MDERNAHLIAFIEAITTGQTFQFEHLVKTAYIAGARREDLLTALEIARFLADVPEPVLTEARATIYAWHWIVGRRLEHRRSLAPPAEGSRGGADTGPAPSGYARLRPLPPPTVPAPDEPV
ncbi:MAG TPA: hypothetical protein VIG69_08155 [Candidatus Methylomirabilis sp.]|jgi:hypothetical protein